jgi:hypothetical protein
LYVHFYTRNRIFTEETVPLTDVEWLLRHDGIAVDVIQAPKAGASCRRVATRYDKLAANYLALVKPPQIASAVAIRVSRSQRCVG